MESPSPPHWQPEWHPHRVAPPAAPGPPPLRQHPAWTNAGCVGPLTMRQPALQGSTVPQKPWLAIPPAVGRILTEYWCLVWMVFVFNVLRRISIGIHFCACPPELWDGGMEDYHVLERIGTSDGD